MTISSAPGLQVKFVMPSSPRYLPVIRGTVAAFTAAIGWDESECRAITLALDEAVANVIRHAYHDRAEGVIELECRESVDGLEVTMLDDGDPPDITKICSREVGCDKPGGLGTHIIRDVMDSVSYQRAGSANRFTARKVFRRKT